MAVKHKLCGKTLAVPPSLCMRCFAVADIKRAVAAERRRVLKIIDGQAMVYAGNKQTVRDPVMAASYDFAVTALALVSGRVRSGRKRAE